MLEEAEEAVEEGVAAGFFDEVGLEVEDAVLDQGEEVDKVSELLGEE